MYACRLRLRLSGRIISYLNIENASGQLELNARPWASESLDRLMEKRI